MNKCIPGLSLSGPISPLPYYLIACLPEDMDQVVLGLSIVLIHYKTMSQRFPIPNSFNLAKPPNCRIVSHVPYFLKLSPELKLGGILGEWMLDTWQSYQLHIKADAKVRLDYFPENSVIQLIRYQTPKFSHHGFGHRINEIICGQRMTRIPTQAPCRVTKRPCVIETLVFDP